MSIAVKIPQNNSVNSYLPIFVASMSLLLVIFVSMPESYSQSTETYGSLSNESTLIVSASPSELSAGSVTHVAVIIENNENHDIKLTRIESVSPWQKIRTLDSPLIIKPNNSATLTLDVLIPPTVEPDTYTLIVSVTDSNEITKTISAELKVKEFAPLKLEYSWILALLSAYFIPAQIIERILEILRLTKPTLEEKSSTDLVEKSTVIIGTKKIYKKFDEIYKTISDLEDQLTFKKQIKTKIEEFISNSVMSNGKLPDEFGNDYKNKLTIDAQISELSTDLSKAKKYQSFLVWTVSLAMSIVPGIIFAYYGLGLLQTVDQSGENIKMIDVVFNSLIIASGTKPIHDIIKRIKGD